MVKTWSNFGQKKVVLTINTQKIFQKIFFLVYLNQAHEDGYGKLSWLKKSSVQTIVMANLHPCAFCEIPKSRRYAFLQTTLYSQ